jgi:hypothetical protein
MMGDSSLFVLYGNTSSGSSGFIYINVMGSLN